ncbi:MAG TPA: CBS domain-containing protein [Xanthobacteraceae bacterium]|nr:CBS domain-containing protein [Xanthobacteraceae bacterium]
MNASDLMTREVVSIRPEAGILEALRLMLDRRISGLPIVDAGGMLVGILTEGDLLRRAELHTEPQRPGWISFVLGPGRLADEYVRTHGRKVGDVMTRNVVSVTEDVALPEIVHLMQRHHITRLPVTKAGLLVGIVSRADLLRALANAPLNAIDTETADAALRARILEEIERQPWGPAGAVDVVVENGDVNLHGVLTDDRERAALHVLVENVPGVMRVRDQLTTIEPLTGMIVKSPRDTAHG